MVGSKSAPVLSALDPESERLLQAASHAYAGGNKAGAASLARQVLLRNPGNSAALQILGVVALDAGDFASARRHLEASNAAKPNAATLNMIGVAASHAGDLPAARAAFARSGELGLVDGWRNLAVSEKGEAQVAAYQKALALAPNDAASHAGLAQALEVRHDVARAKEHAHQALRLDPANALARLVLARVLIRAKDFAGAEAAAAPILQLLRLPPRRAFRRSGLLVTRAIAATMRAAHLKRLRSPTRWRCRLIVPGSMQVSGSIIPIVCAGWAMWSQRWMCLRGPLPLMGVRLFF